MFKKFPKLERGQSLIIIAGAVVVLVAIIALVVDAGNAYVQRRQVQNAMDAGAQAGALALAQSNYETDVLAAVTKYAKANGMDPSSIKAYYVVQDAAGNQISQTDWQIPYLAAGERAPDRIPNTASGLPVVAIRVAGSKTFDTYFAKVIGIKSMTVGADSPGVRSATPTPTPIGGGPAVPIPTATVGSTGSNVIAGACSSDNLFPLAVALTTFSDETGDGLQDVHFEQTDPTYSYRIWENKQTAPGNFGYLTWDGSTSATTLAANMLDTSRSGSHAVNDRIAGSTGTMASSSVQAAIQQYITNAKPVTVPVYDAIYGTGSGVTYNIKAFARFRITSFTYSGQNKYIDGKFQQWVDPRAEGGCTNFGVVSVKLRPPLDESRTILGTVKIQKVTLVSNPSYLTPSVDVVNILDISGSMSESFGAKSKLRAAKDALKNFNTNLRPDLGDQSALVTFPRIDSGSNYSYNCEQRGNTSQYWYAQEELALTTNITGTNGVNGKIESLNANSGTSTAAGIQQGRLTVLGTGHRSTSVAVMILASDGLANTRLNGMWTGFSGSSSNSPVCNTQAVQDAIDQANLSKSDLNLDGLPDTIIFSIAVGDTFNPGALQAIATQDTDPAKPHYFRATDATSMAGIYDQISQRVQQMGSETCQLIPTEEFGSNATIVLKNLGTGATTNLTTNAGGEFILNNVAAGSYQVVSAVKQINGISYSIFTDGLGGPVLASSPTLTVGTASGTYKLNLFLKNSTQITCQ